MARAIPNRRNVLVARGWALGLAGIIALATCSSLGAGSTSMEYRVKAACLYNFLKFVDWPASAFPAPFNPIVIGIVGEDPFDGDLDEIVRGRKVNGRIIQIKRLGQMDDLKECQVLFIGSFEQEHTGEILKRLEGQSVLTVGETKDFLDEGGIINFLIQEGKVRFEININAARQAGLRIDSQLLNLAVAVRPANTGKAG